MVLAAVGGSCVVAVSALIASAVRLSRSRTRIKAMRGAACERRGPQLNTRCWQHSWQPPWTTRAEQPGRDGRPGGPPRLQPLPPRMDPHPPPANHPTRPQTN